MFVVHVDLTVAAEWAAEISAVYQDCFYPAIAQQQGFLESRLLAVRAAETPLFRLVISFETEALQKRWVATALHREVWERMQKSIVGFSIMFFDAVEYVSPLATRR